MAGEMDAFVFFYVGQFGELFRRSAQNVEFAHAAADGGHIVFVAMNLDDVIGKFADDVVEDFGV